MPRQNSVVIGTVVRLSPLQATISITVVDGVPLLHGDDITGVIRNQDVRATDKDKIKLAECFRGGDVVRGVIVCFSSFVASFDSPCLIHVRYRLVTPGVTTYQPLGMIWASFTQLAKQVQPFLLRPGHVPDISSPF